MENVDMREELKSKQLHCALYFLLKFISNNLNRVILIFFLLHISKKSSFELKVLRIKIVSL